MSRPSFLAGLLISLGPAGLLIFVRVLYASVQPKGPPDDIIETRDIQPTWKYDVWEYGVGPRGGSLRRKANIKTTYLRRQKYVLVPNAPAFRSVPFGTYCYFVPSGKWIPFTETDSIGLTGWAYDRRHYTPRAVRTYR